MVGALLLLIIGLVQAHGAELASMVSIADDIVIGTTNALVNAPGLLTFDVSVERVIKGDATLATVHVVHP